MAIPKPEAPVAVDTINTANTVLDAAKKRQKARSFAIAMGLVFLIVLFYLITIFKLGGHLIKGVAS
jgi:hypothetical protein